MKRLFFILFTPLFIWLTGCDRGRIHETFYFSGTVTDDSGGTVLSNTYVYLLETYSTSHQTGSHAGPYYTATNGTYSFSTDQLHDVPGLERKILFSLDGYRDTSIAVNTLNSRNIINVSLHRR